MKAPLLHPPGVWVGRVELPLGPWRRRVRPRPRAHLLAAALEHATFPARLVVAVGETLDLPVLDQPALAKLQPRRAVARDRLGASGAFQVEPLLRPAQPSPPSLAPRKPPGQLVAAGGPMDVVLGRVDPASLREDLGRDLLVAANRPVRRRGRDLAAIERNHTDRDQAGVRAKPKHLPEELAPRAASWRTRKRATVAWSGTWFAVITRNATSSRQRRSIAREDRSPIAVGIDQQRHHRSPDRAPPRPNHARR